MQAVRFDYEPEPRPRQVRLARASVVGGDPVRIGVSGVEVECVIAGVEGGVLTVKVKRTVAKVGSPQRPERQQKATGKKRVG